MAESWEEQREVRMLPPGESGVTGTAAPVSRSTSPVRQLSEMPRDELEHLAEEYGLDATRYQSRQHLVAAIHEQRQMIAGMDRDAMLDVVKWGRRPVSVSASKEQLAREIARIRLMRFAGLSQRGLVILGRLRGLHIRGDEPVPSLVRKLRKQEGIFSRLNRRRRSLLGWLVSSIIGARESGSEYQYLPPQPGTVASSGSAAARAASIKEEIEDAGLIGGITGRIKKSADAYLNQKLDEIEARIDRKLDEIDRRLAEWRDKEIANRIRILKITLWASVIVAGISLVYSYVKVYFYPESNRPGIVQRDDRSR